MDVNNPDAEVVKYDISTEKFTAKNNSDETVCRQTCSQTGQCLNASQKVGETENIISLPRNDSAVHSSENMPTKPSVQDPELSSILHPSPYNENEG